MGSSDLCRLYWVRIVEETAYPCPVCAEILFRKVARLGGRSQRLGIPREIDAAPLQRSRQNSDKGYSDGNAALQPQALFRQSRQTRATRANFETFY